MKAPITRGTVAFNTATATSTDSISGASRRRKKPAGWRSALIGGVRIGVALMDHPANFRHPTTWHARGYGLCSANPSGLASFTGDKSKYAAHTLSDVEKLRFRYLILIHEGDFDAGAVERWYAEFAEP